MPSIYRDGNQTGKITVTYPTREATQQITEAEYRLVWILTTNYNPEYNRTLVAIRFIREQYNIGLYEAKMIVDTIRNCSKLSD